MRAPCNSRSTWCRSSTSTGWCSCRSCSGGRSERVEVIRGRTVLVIALALIIQPVLLAGVRVDHVCPDVLLLLAVLAGVTGGSEAGAIVGFVAGLAADLLLLQTPLGLSALVFAILGFAVGEV